jgi:hypothetical protein
MDCFLVSTSSGRTSPSWKCVVNFLSHKTFLYVAAVWSTFIWGASPEVGKHALSYGLHPYARSRLAPLGGMPRFRASGLFMDYVHMRFLSGLRGLASGPRTGTRLWTTFICLYGRVRGGGPALPAFGSRAGYGLHPYAGTRLNSLIFAHKTCRWTTFICPPGPVCRPERPLGACCWAMDYVYMQIRALVWVCRRFREFF